jgi:hypothetical protein
MMVLAIVNMVLLLMGFLAGLRKEKTDGWPKQS